MRLAATTWRHVGVDDYVCRPDGSDPLRIVDERDGWVRAEHLADGTFVARPRPAPDVPVTVMVPDEADAVGVVSRILGASRLVKK